MAVVAARCCREIIGLPMIAGGVAAFDQMIVIFQALNDAGFAWPDRGCTTFLGWSLGE